MKKIVLADFCVFFFSFSALAAFVFCAGNFQGFTTAAQMLLLDILKYSAFFCLLAGGLYTVYLAAGKIRRHPAPGRLRDFILAGVSFAFGLSALLAAQFIIVVTLPKL